MSGFDIRLAEPSDNAALLALMAQPQPSNGVQFAFERTPDYFASAQISHQQPQTFIVVRRDNQDIVAMVNIGFRHVFVDGRPKLLRYGADLRIAAAYQGGRVLLYINRLVRDCIQDGWYQSVILEDNSKSRGAFEGGRAGLPLYQPRGCIYTHTITACKKQPMAQGNIRSATASDIPAMNHFIQQMAAFYQFLPVYNFWEVEAGHPHFNGMTIHDFLLAIDDEGEIRGLVGLWSQSAFKQTRVVDYSRVVAWLRPFYNAWSLLSGGFILPAKGQAVDYMALHSPLTHPDDTQTFRRLLHSAWHGVRQRGKRAMTLTLSEHDPRLAILADFRSMALKAYQYTVAFKEQHLPVLDAQRIPYFDSGRL